MKKSTSSIAILVLSLCAPAIAFAAVTTFRDFGGVAVNVIRGIYRIIFLSLAIGLSYGVILYFVHSDNEKKREEIKGYLLWGVIGVIVAFGLWGILAILSATLGWGDVGIPIIGKPL